MGRHPWAWDPGNLQWLGEDHLLCAGNVCLHEHPEKNPRNCPGGAVPRMESSELLSLASEPDHFILSAVSPPTIK